MNDDLFGKQGKRCPCCGRVLEHWQFSLSRTSNDGLQSYCKRCQQEYKQKHPDNQYKKHRKDKSLSLW